MNDATTFKQYPMTVTINTPMHSPRLRGMQAHGPHALGSLGDNLRVRINRQDRDLVERIAKKLGMTKAEFARWCTVEVARALDDAPYETSRVITVKRTMPDGTIIEETFSQ